MFILRYYVKRNPAFIISVVAGQFQSKGGRITVMATMESTPPEVMEDSDGTGGASPKSEREGSTHYTFGSPGTERDTARNQQANR